MHALVIVVRDYCWESIIHGHHIRIYKAIWTPEIGEILVMNSSPEDSYAVKVMKGDTIIGHV